MQCLLPVPKVDSLNRVPAEGSGRSGFVGAMHRDFAKSAVLSSKVAWSGVEAWMEWFMSQPRLLAR